MPRRFAKPWGVSRWLLFSESYGTTVAAHYVATVPDRIEAAVLDSLYPADADVLPVTEMQGRLVDRIAADCRADTACAARFPAFGRTQMDEAVAALDATPLAIGHRGAHWRLDGMGLRRLVMAATSFEAGARSVPLLVDAALRRDVRMLAGPVRMFDAGATAGGNLGALFATDCRDRARHHADTLQDDPMRLLAGVPGSVCRDWMTPGEAPRWPIGTAVPMLVLSGGYDSFQPDAAAIVARLGGTVRHVDVPVAVHGARGAGACVRNVIAAFLIAPTAPPDTTCIASMPAPAFVTAVTPVRGPVLLMAPMASGGLPDPPGLLAAALAILALLVALWASWKRRPGNRLRWAWLGTLAAFAPVCGGLAFMATTDAMANAAWIYGLPANWSWVAWLAPACFVLGAVAATRDAGASTRITGGLACIGAVAWMLAGWSPFG